MKLLLKSICVGVLYALTGIFVSAVSGWLLYAAIQAWQLFGVFAWMFVVATLYFGGLHYIENHK